MSELKTLDVIPRGDVNHTYEWNSNEIQFYNGRVQKNRKKIHPNRNMSFTVSGGRRMWEYLRDFYDEHHGCLMPFFFDYDGKRLQCRFADKIAFSQKRELKDVLGFEATITLSVENTKEPYVTPPNIKRFDLPIRGTIEDEIDWNTDVLDMNIQGRKETWKIPVHKFSFNLSGSLANRQKLIELYKRYGDFVPLEFSANDSLYKCFMPSTLEITDKREGARIVGYTANMTLTSVNELQDILSLRNSFGFLLGDSQSFDVSSPMGFLLGKMMGSLEMNRLVAAIVGKVPSRFEMNNPIFVMLGKEMTQ